MIYTYFLNMLKSHLEAYSNRAQELQSGIFANKLYNILGLCLNLIGISTSSIAINLLIAGNAFSDIWAIFIRKKHQASYEMLSNVYFMNTWEYNATYISFQKDYGLIKANCPQSSSRFVLKYIVLGITYPNYLLYALTTVSIFRANQFLNDPNSPDNIRKKDRALAEWEAMKKAKNQSGTVACEGVARPVDNFTALSSRPVQQPLSAAIDVPNFRAWDQGSMPRTQPFVLEGLEQSRAFDDHIEPAHNPLTRSAPRV